MSVVVALSLVIVMGFVALAVDLGSIYSSRQQLQNGADAAALAIAQNCQRNPTTCTGTAASATAAKYVTANKLDGQATAVAVLDAAHGTIQVDASSTHVNWFAGILGISTSPVGATAKAAWGVPSGGPTLPIAFSWCAFYTATGGWDAKTGMPASPTHVVLNIVEKTCTPPAHNEVPGGFGSLSGSHCVADVVAGTWVMSDTGNNGPNSCAGFDWATVVGKPILVPIFDDFKGSGSNAQYKIKGLAAFNISAICLGPNAKVPTTMSKCPSNKRIEGTFIKYTDLTGNYIIDPTATNFGTGEVGLKE
ncbi:MAG: Tad domain-containing protein [Propionibacteriaceae bacterium]